jgi:GNAT superfamily N-acetyltransferase
MSIARARAERYLQPMSRASGPDATEAAVRAAMHRNNTVALDRVAHLNPNAETATQGPLYLVDAATPEAPFFNQAVAVGEPGQPSHLEIIERWYSARGSPFRLMLRDDLDRSLIDAAKAAGYAIDYTEPALYLELPTAIAEGPQALVIREVESDTDLQRYGPIGWQVDGLEYIGMGIARTARDLGFTMLLGEVDGQAVASSMAVVTDHLVGTYNVAVEAPFRRRGFGTAMVIAAIEAGRRGGATTAWIGSTPMGHGVYERLSFEQKYEYVALMRG